VGNAFQYFMNLLRRNVFLLNRACTFRASA
jgi:hypothetical protein